MANPIKNLIVRIDPSQLKICNRCGCDRLAWVQFKSGKWALVATSTSRPFWHGDSQAPQGLWAIKNAFHNCADYRLKQAQRNQELAAYAKASEDNKLRETWCHPKADNPCAILKDVLGYLWTERCSEVIEHQHFMDCAAVLTKPMEELSSNIG